MISKDEFEKLVKNSIFLKDKDREYTYLKIDDDACVCPYCKQQMKIKIESESNYKLYCNCKESLTDNNEISRVLKEIEELKIQYDKLQKKIEKKSLEIFKELFQRDVVPNLKKELQLQIDDIMKIKWN